MYYDDTHNLLARPVHCQGYTWCNTLDLCGSNTPVTSQPPVFMRNDGASFLSDVTIVFKTRSIDISNVTATGLQD